MFLGLQVPCVASGTKSFGSLQSGFTFLPFSPALVSALTLVQRYDAWHFYALSQDPLLLNRTHSESYPNMKVEIDEIKEAPLREAIWRKQV